MKTLTELDAVEYAKRDKAWRFERLTDDKVRLTKSIERLKAQAPNIKALEQMQELCTEIPKGLSTAGGRFMPGGFEVRDLLQSIIVGALGEVLRKKQATDAALKKAKADLVKVEAALSALDKER